VTTDEARLREILAKEWQAIGSNMTAEVIRIEERQNGSVRAALSAMRRVSESRDAEIAKLREEDTKIMQAYVGQCSLWQRRYETADAEIARLKVLIPFDGFSETFRSSRDDLDAMRGDAAASVERGEKFLVSVSVAPAVLYLSWPNAQHDPANEDSNPYRCISLHIPLPAETVAARAAIAEMREPTEDMCNATVESRHEQPIGDFRSQIHAPHWRAMIDAALKDET
jgi:hypothetical protein